MIPAVFTYDFARRCLTLLNDLEPVARKISGGAGIGPGPLTTTFTVAMAMPLIVVPIERLGTYKKASKHDRSTLPTMYARLSEELAKPFGETKLGPDRYWSLVTVNGVAHQPADWESAIDAADGIFADQHRDDLSRLKAEVVLNGLRCALAHGSIAYLDRHGKFSPGQEADVIALFSLNRNGDQETTSVFAIHQDDFLVFLRSWAQFLDEIGHDELLDPARATGDDERHVA